jgi:simple sugar transport system permease protein
MIGDISIPLLIASLMVASTPILLAALGELVVEKSGVLNLGVEGMMIMGAVAGLITGIETGSPYPGFLAAAVTGAAVSLIFAFLTQVLLSNQVATGLALTLFGLGFSALLGQGYQGMKAELLPKVPIPGLAAIPGLGPMFFSHDLVVYFSLLMVPAIWWFLARSRAGMILRAIGANHDSAHALGYRVVAMRIAAVAFGGAMAGLGGAYVSLARVAQWTDGITAGQGWIALAIVVFAAWKPGRALFGAYLFGGMTVLQLNLQAAGVKVPVEILTMSPYLVTILMLVIISADKAKAALSAPAMLGQPFHASG